MILYYALMFSLSEAKHLGSRVVALTVLGAAPAAAGTAGGQHGRQWW